MICAGCGKRIPYEQGAWLEYAGWARPRAQRKPGSGSSLIDRQPTGRALCGECGIKRDMGIPFEQQRLA